MSSTAVALVTDLMFATKIRSTGEAVGTPVQTVRSIEKLVESAADVGLVIVDMNAAGVDPAEAIRAVRAQHPERHVVAFLSHVQHELATAAKEAGAHEVMPRSKFASELPEILKR